MAQVRDTYMGKYVDVAASQTSAVKTTSSATGAIGDYIDTIVIIPETTGAGTIALLDDTTSINILVTGTLSNLAPITINCGWRSVNGGWSITTGANVHVRISGRF